MKPATSILYKVFVDCMRPLVAIDGLPPIAVALSGGPDSTALAYIAYLYRSSCASPRAESTLGENTIVSKPTHMMLSTAMRSELMLNNADRMRPSTTKQCPSRIASLIVNHQMRRESEDEAAKAYQWADSLNLNPYLIRIDWDEHKHCSAKKKRKLERARDARYTAMMSKCEELNISLLLVAHHADDQVEGFLMRLLRGSGNYGLCGMHVNSHLPQFNSQSSSVTILRPFLGIRKTTILQCLKENGVDWISDPSNIDQSFYRVKIRTLLKAEEEENIAEEASPSLADDVLNVMAACRDMRDDMEQRARILYQSARRSIPRRTIEEGTVDWMELQWDVLRKESAIQVLQILLSYITTCLCNRRDPVAISEKHIRSLLHLPLHRAIQIGGCLLRVVRQDGMHLLRIQRQRNGV